mgnify:FL=1|jgi:TonB family protein
MIDSPALVLAAFLLGAQPAVAEEIDQTMVQCPYAGVPRISQRESDAKATSWTGREKGWQPASDGGPALIGSPPLKYPKRFLKPYQQGVVIVISLIDENGNVGGAFVECSTDEFFEQSALQFAKGQRFFPARDGTGTIRMLIRQPIIFAQH